MQSLFKVGDRQTSVIRCEPQKAHWCVHPINICKTRLSNVFDVNNPTAQLDPPLSWNGQLSQAVGAEVLLVHGPIPIGRLARNRRLHFP